MVDPNERVPAGAICKDGVNSMLLPTIKTPTGVSEHEIDIDEK